MKCPRCQQDNPTDANFCKKCGTPLNGSDNGPYEERSQEVQHLTRALREALEQQTATSEILRVISSSPTDAQPVFDIIAEHAMRLCGADIGLVEKYDGGELINLVAVYGLDEAGVDAVWRGFPMAIDSETAAARAVRSRAVAHIPDVLADPVYLNKDLARAMRYQSALAVPMLQDGQVIGVIFVARAKSGRFTDKQIALLKTFADQAVIAIENVRLFKELQEKNRAVTEALEQQTTTSEILRVISSSPTDVQPTFEAIARGARRLCDAAHGMVFRFDGELIHLAAHDNLDLEQLEAVRSVFPIRPGRQSVTARAILTGALVHVRDRREDPEVDYSILSANFPTTLAVPLLRAGVVLGAITVTRAETRLFSERQIELLKTFADQAVIAIENVRLFTELQASNRELTTALDTQTATSDILRVISQSRTDVQPVFDAILASAVRLLGAYTGALTRLAGDQIALAALTSIDDARDAAVRATFPHSLQSEDPHAQALRDRAPLNIADAHSDPRLPDGARAFARARGFRSWVLVPLLRHEEAVGSIGVTRRDPGGFTDEEIALLRTFADQAVIAIENARLLTELQVRTHELTRSVGELQALGEVSRAVSSTLDLETVLNTIVARAVELSATNGGVIYEYDETKEEFHLIRASHRLDEELGEVLRAAPIHLGEGVTGKAAALRAPVQVADVLNDPTYDVARIRAIFERRGYRSLLAVPLLFEQRVIGVLAVWRQEPGGFAADVVNLLQTFATQSVLAILNARLFREIEQKSRELEAASQHKSEFLANMSHELRTPLNAIIGFSEVLSEGMFGEINEKQTEYLGDILESGQHLLSLINDILDLSKIEAGRMELEPADFDLPSAIENALILVRERAARRGIALHQMVDEQLGQITGDERKVKQVLLNLLSNALKFTPEGGRINVRAGIVDGTAEISVTDTGVGIAPEDQEAVFEEFRQVGGAEKKAEGTGLGLTLCRKFVELHGGRISVKSQVGAGSTFTFALPLLGPGR